MCFCALTAVALGEETLRSESEKRRLADSVRLREEAVRDVAHELRNPLTVIQGTVATVRHTKERGLDPETERELLATCEETCQRLTRLLNNMLDTARMESGRELELRVEETNVPALAEAVLASLRRMSSSHRLTLESTLHSRSATVDADKLFQILTNLIHNAIKYSPNGGDVIVRLWEENGSLRFSVSDQGIGMTPEQQARLFQPFERVVDRDRNITGTGIGLHLVKRLVEAHGGTILVNSEYGKGTAIHFSLLENRC